jgi:phage FluMu protein Com
VAHGTFGLEYYLADNYNWAMMTMRCAKCGAEIPEGSPVCRSCFEPVKSQGFFGRLRSAFSGGATPAGQSSPPTTRVNVKVTQKFKIRDPKTGEVNEYQSLDEVPAEYREKIRQARNAAMHGQGGQKISFTDAAGQTHTYNSLDEVPPDIRALIEKSRG